jgi:PKD repeat protein
MWTASYASGLTGGAGNGVGLIAETLTNLTGGPLNAVYTVTPVSAAGCAGNTFTITVPVNPEPAGANAIESPVCSDVPFTFNPQSKILNSITTNFTWTANYGSDLSGGAGNGSGTIAETLTNIEDAVRNAVYTITPISGGCQGTDFTITVPIRPEPVGVAKSKIVCSDVAVDYNLINNIATPPGNNVGSIFSWIAAANGDVTNESTSAQTGGLINDIITNVTNLPSDVVYTVTPKSVAGCFGNAFDITITVNPEPVGSNSSVVICSDLAVGYNLQDNVNAPPGNNLASNFSWYVAVDNTNVNGESLLARNGTIISDILINVHPSNNTNQTIAYTVNPVSQGNSCAGDPFTITVDINPRAKISAGPDLAVCQDLSGIALLGSVTYAPNGVFWDGGTGAFSSPLSPSSDYTFAPGEVNTTVLLTLTANDPAGPCPVETDQLLLKVNPLPIVFFNGFPGPLLPPEMAENDAPVTLSGNETGGLFTIEPSPPSLIGATVIGPGGGDQAAFDPSAVKLGQNFVTYTYTDINGCTNFSTQEIITNAITDIDFAVQGGTQDANGHFEICANTGMVKLLGVPAASTGKSPETRFESTDGHPTTIPIQKIDDDYFINTTGLASGEYRITYIYKNADDAVNSAFKYVKIFASPVAAFSSSNNCIASDVVFTENSTINPTPFGTTIASWEWNFGDGDIETSQQHPSKRYSEADTYYVTLEVTTEQGCSNKTAALANPIRVGDVPVPDFKWSSICNRDFTKFEDESDPGNISVITDYTWDFGDADILSGVTAGSVPVGQHGGRTEGTYSMPDHLYVSYGTYDVTLTVNTNDGCANSITKKVFILPYSTVKPLATSGYFESFETTDGGWIAEAFNATNSSPVSTLKSDTSWIWGIPAGAHIQSGARSSQRAWWTGDNANTYFRNENSVVNGPCFDLRELKRPMISLDYFSDMDLSDGAVLQYSINGGIDWNIVGTNQNKVQGINWFNGSSILSNPGSQILGQYGWTGNAQNEQQGIWKNGRFNLDMINPGDRDQVRLRIAFASNDGNVTLDPYDGFAFDNVFVGDKKRTVLVENFVNGGSTGSIAASQHLDDLYDDQDNDPLWHINSDFFKLQYHMSVPDLDQLNRDNPTDPGARAFFYNIDEPPYTIMDGILGSYYNKTFNGGYAQINATEVDRRALEDPLFVIDAVEFDLTAPSDILRGRIDFTYIDSLASLSNPVTFQVVLVETDVNGNRNVVRKLILDSEGQTETRTWRYKDTFSINVDYTLDVPVVDPTKLYVAVFVQEKNPTRILQATIVKAPSKVGIPPVGLPDDPATAEIRNISVYPNPASKQVNFYLENTLSKDYQWQIVDQRGVRVLEGELNRDLSTPQQVEIKDIANGIYFVRFALADKTVIYKKLAILNRN